jgi:predicted DCC family thiol-disulfide oxidoreductase YuxK
MAEATLLYDGDCGVCDQGMQRMRTRMKPPVTIASYQSMDIDAMGVRLDTVVNQGPVLVQGDADVLVGPAAIAQVMQLSGRPYAPIGKVMNAPGIRQVLAWIGPKLYRQRYRMPGAGESCKVPTTESPKAA